MYKNETAFSKALTKKLNKAGLNVTRLESHSTGNGIPDMFVQGFGWDCFIELKNMDHDTTVNKLKVAWRPGQQAWMTDYRHYHRCNKTCLTIVAAPSFVYVIRNTALYINNIVNLETTGSVHRYTWDEWKDIDIWLELKYWSETISLKGISCSGTGRDAVITFAKNIFGNEIMVMDWDPEVIWDSAIEQRYRYCASYIQQDADDDFNEAAFIALSYWIYLELKAVYTEQHQ